MKKLHVLHDFRDLEAYGINALTGEACAYSMRILCDLSEEGRAIMASYWGVKEEGFTDNWNSMVGDKPAVASCMISREELQGLLPFILINEGYEVVVKWKDNGGFGGYSKERLKEVKQHAERIYVSKSGPQSGGRMTHQMSGRNK